MTRARLRTIERRLGRGRGVLRQLPPIVEEIIEAPPAPEPIPLAPEPPPDSMPAPRAAPESVSNEVNFTIPRQSAF